MAKDNFDTVRQVYARVLARGRMEDPATSEILPELFDPEVHLRQMSALAGTAGDFHGYAGVVESGRETIRPFAELEFVPEEMQAVGDQVATVALVRGIGRGSGAPFEGRVGHLFTLRDGRVVRFEVFDDPAQAFNAAGLVPDTVGLAPDSDGTAQPD
jgi:ketosteroid isomerase-like protein